MSTYLRPGVGTPSGGSARATPGRCAPSKNFKFGLEQKSLVLSDRGVRLPKSEPLSGLRVGWPALALLLACPSEDSAGGGTDSETGGILTSPSQEATSESPGDGDDSSGNLPPSCGESDFVLEALPTKVLLVLDKSASMVNFTWDHDGDADTPEVTRWQSLHETVSTVTTTFDASIEFGALLYPSLNATSDYSEAACLVESEPEVPVAPTNAAAILAGIPPMDATAAIQGGTPSRLAIESAVAHLTEFNPSQPRAILFVTDGEANCQEETADVTELFEVYDPGLLPVVADAFETNTIPTYVVGIAIRDEVLPTEVDGNPDGVNPSDELDDLAEAGGRPQAGGQTQYFATTNQAELEAALAEIVGEEFSCQIPLDPEPDYPEYVEVEVGDDTIDRVTDCATEDGWVFVNPDGPYDAVELCGAACDALAQQGTAHAIYGCPPAN